MTSALRWAAMSAILPFHNCEGQSHKTVSTDHNFWRERRAEADSNRGPSAYQPNILPLSQTGSHWVKSHLYWTATLFWRSAIPLDLSFFLCFRAFEVRSCYPDIIRAIDRVAIAIKKEVDHAVGNAFSEQIWNRTRPRALVRNRQTRELISTRKT